MLLVAWSQVLQHSELESFGAGDSPDRRMSEPKNALDLARSIDKGVRVKLSGGREGEHAHSGVSSDCSCLHVLSIYNIILNSLRSLTACSQTQCVDYLTPSCHLR